MQWNVTSFVHYCKFRKLCVKISLSKLSLFKRHRKLNMKICFIVSVYFKYFFSKVLIKKKTTKFCHCRHQNEKHTFHFCDILPLERVLGNIWRVYELLHTTIWQTWTCQGQLVVFFIFYMCVSFLMMILEQQTKKRFYNFVFQVVWLDNIWLNKFKEWIISLM